MKFSTLVTTNFLNIGKDLTQWYFHIQQFIITKSGTPCGSKYYIIFELHSFYFIAIQLSFYFECSHNLSDWVVSFQWFLYSIYWRFMGIHRFAFWVKIKAFCHLKINIAQLKIFVKHQIWLLDMTFYDSSMKFCDIKRVL